MNLQLAPAQRDAVAFLSRAERTESELRAHLEMKGHEPQVVEVVVDWSRSKGYISDTRVTDRETELAVTRRIGREKLTAKLTKRGLDTESAEGYSAERERAIAVRLLEEKKIESAAKAARYLSNRGFSEETVREVIARRFPDLESSI